MTIHPARAQPEPSDGRPAPVRQRRSSTGRRSRWLVVLLTSVGIAVFFPLQYYGSSLESLGRQGVGLADTYAPLPAWIHAVFYVHITFAGLALLIGPLQFAAVIRRRAINVHRWIGRTYVLSVAAGSAAALIMSTVSSVAFLGFFGFGTLALLWAFTTYRGYRAVRSGKIAEHQAWMIRSFALTYAAVTLRVWLIVFIVLQNLVVGDSLSEAQIYTNAYAPVPFLCWLPNIVIAEWLILRRNLPGLRFGTPDAVRPS